MALPTESVLDAFIDRDWNELKRATDFKAPTLFEDSLNTLNDLAIAETYNFHVNGVDITGIRVPISMPSDDEEDQDGVPVRAWHSHQEVVEILREWMEEEDELDAEREKLDAYDRAMSIL